MKITKPEEMKLNDMDRLESIISLFESQLKKADKGENYYHLIVSGEYSRDLCNEVEKRYTDAGWVKVNCRTSSQNGERPGLTGLILHRP